MTPYYQREGIVIYHGDCLDIMPQLIEAGVKVDAVVTDPPWNMGYFEDDQKSWSDYKKWIDGCKKICEELGNGQTWFLSTKSIPHVSSIFSGYTAFASIKNFSQMTPAKLPNCWGIAFIKSTSYMGNWRNWFLCNTAGMLSDRTDHPTPRTCDVMEYIMGMHAWDTILDPFLGSGTTAVACIRTGRKCIGIELEEKYCAIAAKRCEEEFERTALIEPAMKLTQAEMFE